MLLPSFIQTMAQHTTSPILTFRCSPPFTCRPPLPSPVLRFPSSPPFTCRPPPMTVHTSAPVSRDLAQPVWVVPPYINGRTQA